MHVGAVVTCGIRLAMVRTQMMNKVVACIPWVVRATRFLLLSVLLASRVSAQFAFTTNNGVAEITSYSGTNTWVDVPDILEGCPVTSIGASAFSWQTGITRVTLPIGVTNIGDSAFGYCSSLAEVNIPEGTVRLGNSAFHHCTSLSGILIPQSVTDIGSTPFSDCGSLLAINVAESNPLFASDQGVLLNKSLTTLIECPGGKAGDYVVPDGVIHLTAWAFFSCRLLKSISLPESVVDLGGVATFYNCSGLTHMVVPENVTSVPHSAFAYCTNLVGIHFGTNVASLGQDAFSQCTSLASLTFPDSLRSIGWGAFGYCSSLSTIEFGTNVEDIGNSAFASCYQLSSLWLPDSLKTIQSSAFATCSALGTVHFGSSLSQLAGDAFKNCHQLVAYEVSPQNTNFQSLDGVLFDRDYTTLLRCPLGFPGVYAVPASVTEIGPEAFYDCARLSGIVLPASVASIGYNAFQGCTGLTSMTFPAGVTNVQPFALAWCGTNLTSVFFAGNAPDGMDESDFYGDAMATVYYLPSANGWGSNFCGRPAVLWNPEPQTSHPSFGIQPNGFGFPISGSDDIPFVVEVSTNLSSGVWSALQTNILAGGTMDFRDADWTNNRARFYRIRSP